MQTLYGAETHTWSYTATLTCGVMPHQKLEYAPVESSMGAMTDLFSAISRLRVLGLVRMLSVSANWSRRRETNRRRSDR